MTPICPKCGSVRVERINKDRLKCLEKDCGHEGMRSAFMKGGPGSYKYANTHWRDPVAMSMDGYDE